VRTNNRPVGTTTQPWACSKATKQRAPITNNGAYSQQHLYAMTSKASLIKYPHQCLFSLPKLTLLKAIENNQFITWPGLAVEVVKSTSQTGHLPRIKVIGKGSDKD